MIINDSWQSRDPKEQKELLDLQLLGLEAEHLITEWAAIYCRLARALADAFDEEQVLDILEETWWNLQYEGGLTFREDFEKDPREALQSMARRWHCKSCQNYSSAIYDEPIVQEDRWDLFVHRCYHEVFVEMDERKIGVSWCMSDVAAVRGWSPKVVMTFPNVLLRGSNFCHQIREIVQDADPSHDHWSREKSELYGWRSIKKAEEMG